MVSFKWDDKRAKEIAYEEGVARGEVQGEARGEARGDKRRVIDVVLTGLKEHYPLKMISTLTKLSPEEVEKIAKDHGLAF